MLDGYQDCASNNRRNAEEGEDRAFAFPMCGKEGTSECSHKLDRTERNVEKDCVEGVIAKRLDDQGAEGGNATAWNSGSRILAGRHDGVLRPEMN